MVERFIGDLGDKKSEAPRGFALILIVRDPLLAEEFLRLLEE